MNKLIILLVPLILLCGCENRKCIKSHEIEDICVYYISQKIGDVSMMQPVYYPCTRTVCDEYEVEK